jgi:hypothetical protein
MEFKTDNFPTSNQYSKKPKSLLIFYYIYRGLKTFGQIELARFTAGFDDS